MHSVTIIHRVRQMEVSRAVLRVSPEVSMSQVNPPATLTNYKLATAVRIRHWPCARCTLLIYVLCEYVWINNKHHDNHRTLSVSLVCNNKKDNHFESCIAIQNHHKYTAVLPFQHHIILVIPFLPTSHRIHGNSYPVHRREPVIE